MSELLEKSEQADTALKDTKLQIAEVITEIGLEIDKIAPRIIERLELLNRLTKTVEDGKRAIELARSIFAYYESDKKDQIFSELEKKIVMVGSIFSDIGKTGPGEATLEQQNLIADIFAIENIIDQKMTVKDFLHMFFADTAEQKLQTFQSMNLDPMMTMRTFWNLHSLWTLQIISGDGVPPEAVAGAAIHHIVDGINPDNILGLDAKFNKFFGENASFDRPEKLIILLDKFDAFCRRGGMAKEAAIKAIQAKISQNEIFAHDQQFQILLDDLLHVVSVNKN